MDKIKEVFYTLYPYSSVDIKGNEFTLRMLYKGESIHYKHMCISNDRFKDEESYKEYVKYVVEETAIQIQRYILRIERG